MRCTRRSGFNRVELLVLLAMATVVTCLGAAVINRTRETAQRIVCANNLKRLALAAHAYSDAHRSLPPGWWGSIPFDAVLGWNGQAPALKAGPGNGPFAQLLPFLNEDKLYKQVSSSIVWDPKQAVEDAWATTNGQPNVAAFKLACTPLNFLQCPADVNTPVAEANIEDGAGAVAHYTLGGMVLSYAKGGTVGSPKNSKGADPKDVDWGTSAPVEWSGSMLSAPYDARTKAYNPMARVNYLPVAGLGQGRSPFYTQFEGVFTGRSATTLAAIAAADGTANTLMFGETCGQFYPLGGEHVFQENLFSAAGAPTHRGLQQRCAPGIVFEGHPVPDCDNSSFASALGQKTRFATFSSPHAAGVQFSFCDGSVRMIAPGHTWELGTPDWYLFQELAGFHDGFHCDTRSLMR